MTPTIPRDSKWFEKIAKCECGRELDAKEIQNHVIECSLGWRLWRTAK